MGLFDGIGSSSQGSTAELAKILNLPVVLIVDDRGKAASLAALIKGFREQGNGTLYNMLGGSFDGKFLTPGMGVYSSTKASINILTSGADK